MVMGSATVSNRSVSEKERVKKGSKLQKNGVTTSPAKRNKNPEIRVVGARIYDPINGKTCHQCRQKTMDFVAACTNLKNNKRCTLMLCHKCLLNRYGEKAEEVADMKEWICPRKKRGHQPTGILINTAKATGFSSVSEMLLMGAGHLSNTAHSPKKEVLSSPGKRGKENSFDGKLDVNLPNQIEKKSKEVKETQKGNIEENGPMNVTSGSPNKRKLKQDVHEFTKEPRNEEIGSCGSEKMPKKKKVNGSEEMNIEKNEKEIKKTSLNGDAMKLKRSRKNKSENDYSRKNEATLARRTSPRKLKVCSDLPHQVVELENAVDQGKNVKDTNITTEKNCMDMNKCQVADWRVNIQLPVGKELNSVAGIDILDVKKGQPEHVLKDLLHGRGRRGKFSLTVQFLINLLSIVLSDRKENHVKLNPSYGKGSWFDALKKCLSESKSVLRVLGLDSFDKAADYEALEASDKLKLLNILCDEVLETEKLRVWMEIQRKNHNEKVREAKQKVAAAKDEEKNLKQKMQNDIAQAIIAKHGANLSISEHEAIVSDIKQETAKAHAKVLESMGMLLKNNKSDVLRTEPIFSGVGGHAYWKLHCMGKSDLVHQDAGQGDGDATLDDKWFLVDEEGEKAIEKFISLSNCVEVEVSSVPLY
ncbi:zinc-finger domain of monoamine-oxidase Arepressor R [Striga asiatica]|uniref:Zinc-finger domain of monoamine-oxidase Arepressor R n=1 Tax=Striga asiatica TaxID=4170 RepID=A0A5A7RHT3_STRAF|nr:zinc-finger domain of monoamine-oxidase Arepressor R [Striga asiatica]